MENMRLCENDSKKESLSESWNLRPKEKYKPPKLRLIAPPGGSIPRERNSKVRIHSRQKNYKI